MQQIIDIIEDIPGAEFVKPSPYGQIWSFEEAQTAIDFAREHADAVSPHNWVVRAGASLDSATPEDIESPYTPDAKRLTIRINR